jgi:dienelactone hydrolase
VTRETGLAEAPCLAEVTDYAGPGPFHFEEHTLDRVKVWLPELPSGCRAPIAHFANGTGATCATYRGVLDRLASHGFVAACYETPSSGDGTQCMTALEQVFEAFPDRTARRIGSLGQSSGGQGALYCVRYAHAAWGTSALYAVHTMAGESGFGASGDVPWQTAYREITAPVLMIHGTEDTLVSASWVGRSYEALSDAVEAYWYEAVGAPHIPIPVDVITESAVAWLRWQLLGDRRACEHFKAMPDSDAWNLTGSQNETDC